MISFTPLLAASIGLLPLSSALSNSTQGNNGKIDRHALVTRHNVVLTTFDAERPLQVGNGEFAFGMDATGLQTFVPFNTMSQWGWGTTPLPPNLKISDFHGQVWDTHGRPVRYWMPDPDQPVLSDWLAGNPHRINLGRLGLILTKKDGTRATQGDISNIRQTLDLWSGTVVSRFDLEDQPITVHTACHPVLDSVSVQIESPLVAAGRLSAFLDAPGDNTPQFANFVGDWTSFDRLKLLPSSVKNRADFVKTLYGDNYHVSLTWRAGSTLKKPSDATPKVEILRAEYGAENTWVDVAQTIRNMIKAGNMSVTVGNSLAGDPIKGVVKNLKIEFSVNGVKHVQEARENETVLFSSPEDHRRYILQPGPGGTTLAFTCTFAKDAVPKELPNAAETFKASQTAWPKYWQSGGAVDLSGSLDPRWKELERRIVLSQYLMAVNEAGSLPPQESGLVNNGWFGRFHMEMYWWHAAHWALWNRWAQLDRSLGIYDSLLAQAKARAKSQGYLGAHWPKCIGPGGREWPHIIHGLLIWQQPHPMYFAELDYRAHPTKATLKKWDQVVESTADFLATYAFFDPKEKHYVLGPPVVVVSENTDPKTTTNPAFEVAYWRFGLETAQKWRKRQGLPRKSSWDKVLKGLAPVPQQDGLYVLYQGVKDMWTKWNFEHPALTGIYGILPGDGVDPATMRRTLDKVLSAWNLDRTWGWDYPMLAMCAARLGEPDRAVDLLLTSSPGFQFDVRGLATGGPFPYFPSNGGLLYAVAMMAAGWDENSQHNAPGFPNRNRWKVRFEGLSPAP